MQFLKSFCLSIFLCVILVTTLHAQSVQALFRDKDDPVAGNPRGAITVVEFFDYQCSYCKTMAPVLENIIRKNPDVRIVFKEFPIRGPGSDYAAAAALAANKQGKYTTFNHALLNLRQPLTPYLVLSTAKHSGLDIPKLEKDLQDASIKAQLQANLKLADELQLNGTPAFFIGKTNASDIKNVKFVYGAMSQSELQNAINHARR